MRAKIVLIARVNDGTGRFPFLNVTTAKNSIVIPFIREKDGKSFNLEQIIGFYARYQQNGKRRVEPLGKDARSAYIRYLQIEMDQARIKSGLLPVSGINISKVMKKESDRSLSTLAKQFKNRIVTLGRKDSTIYLYMRAVNALTDHFPQKSVDEITATDILAHIALLKKTTPKRSVGDPQHNVRNHIKILNTFFHSFNVKPPLPMKEVKRPMVTRPNRYSIEMINKMLDVASEDEKDLIQFFLNTGFRRGEVEVAKWSDIDFKEGSINVYPKPEYNWTSKDGEARLQDIVLQDKFIKRMKTRKLRVNTELIFTSSTGTRELHMLKVIKDVAKRAGIEGKRITLHAFRRTFGSIVAKEYGIEQARIWLGHSNIETTQRYIAADEMTTVVSRQKVASMFSGVGD